MKEYRVLDEMNILAQILPKQRNYSLMLYTFAFGLLSISSSAYNYVQSELPLPDIRSVYRHQSELMVIKPFMLTNLTFLPEILKEYKDIIKNKSNQQESFILAVDAMSSTPFANIRKNLSVTGLTSDDINADESFLIEYSIQKFENYIQKISDKIVNSLFVYSLHPLNHKLPTFFLYILPSNSGKANNFTTSILTNITEICKKNDVDIIGIASDGDTAMEKFHKKNIELFESNKFKSNKNLLYFSDILHILKRGRYTFVKQIYSKNDYINKIDLLKELFNLPHEIFKNESYTKMHDSLAVRLFSISNLLISYNNYLFDETIFIFPFCLLECSVHNTNLNISERFFVLELLKYYCIKIKKNNTILNSFKYQIKYNIIQDILSTVYSFIFLFKNTNSIIDSNRCSTSPLEHNFGIARIGCKDKNRMDSLIKKFSHLNVRRIDKFNFTKKIMRHRINNFGIEIDTTNKNVDYEKIQKISENLISNIFDDLKTKNISKNIHDLFGFFSKINIEMPKDSDFICKSSDAYVNPSTVLSIQSRFKKTMTKKCAWSPKEVNLLINLIKDIGGNCTILSTYLEKRSINAIYRKATSLYKKNKIQRKPFLK